MDVKKSILITDLDNTLFDWVEIWYQSFSAMLNTILDQTGIEIEQLKSEIRQVHQKHGTSEYAFLLEEVPSLVAFAGNRPVMEVYSEAIDAYRQARRDTLALYPSVMDTLLKIKNSGCMVVGYTESMAFYTGYRIRKLELDGVIDVLFSPEDHELPENMTREEIRSYPSETYEFRGTVHEHTPKGELKPNPHILQEIITYMNERNDACVYVGDSLHKDIAMAKDAGIDHAWAKYGTAQSRPEYELLRDVTHWTNEDVEREKEIRVRHVNPDNTLETGFSDIVDIYEFQR